MDWSKLTSPGWDKATEKVIRANRKWRQENPQDWEEQRRYQESQKRRKNEDTQASYQQELTLFDLGYD